jgi:hypothetical protein
LYDLNIGRMDDDFDQVANGVGNDMTLTPLDSLARII